jgi:hypothetical protein
MNDSTALTVLDGRFPVAVTQPPVLFDQLTREWDDRKTTSRAIARGARRDACTEITYINAHPRRPAPLPPPPPPPPTSPAALPPPPRWGPPAVYPELAEAALKRDFDTRPQTIILDAGLDELLEGGQS